MRNWVVLGIVTAVALVLRAMRLGASELWFDEAYSGILTFADPKDLLRMVRAEVTPPLYYLALRGWAAIFGHGVVALRALSAVAGVLTAVLACLIARRASSTAGLAAGLAVALSPIHVYYSQEARMYALLLLWICASMAFLLRALEEDREGRKRWWCGYALCAAAAIWTHYLALFVLPAALLLAIERRREGLRGALLATLGAVCLSLPLLLKWMVPQSQLPATDFVVRLYRSIPPFLAIPRTLEIFTPGALFPGYDQFRFGEPFWRPAAFLLLGAALLPGLLVTIRGKGGGAPRLARAGVAFLGVPLGLMALVSFFRPVYLLGRYDLIALPGFALLAGVGVAALPRVARLLIAAAALVLAAGSLAPHYEKASDYTALSRAVSGELGPALDRRDIIVYTGGSLPVVRYPLLLRGRDNAYRTVPASTARHPGWIDVRALASQDTRRAEAARVMAEAVDAASVSGGKVWLIVDPRAPGAQENVDALGTTGWKAVARIALPAGPPGIWRLTLSAIAFENPLAPTLAPSDRTEDFPW